MRIEIGGQAPSTVVIEPGAARLLPEFLPTHTRRVFVIYTASTARLAQYLASELRTRGLEAATHEIPDAEAGKTGEVAAGCWAHLGQLDFTRSDVVVGVGGGAVTDLAGFVAATWLRGVALIQVPTSLNGMVDAAVGGKTGINTAEGKNLVGCFHSPRAVLCDLAALGSLPERELISGTAEVIKCGFIADPEILTIVESGAWRERLAELVARSVQVKADVVSQDLRESGLREILNYGHTFGHAIELAEHFRWRHGEAVAVGMVFAAELACLAGLLSDDVVARHRSILASVGLPVSHPGGSFDELLAGMRRDKKTRGDALRFVVLRDVANVTRLEAPDLGLVEEAAKRVLT